MEATGQRIDSTLEKLQQRLLHLRAGSDAVNRAILRLRSDADATRFHLHPKGNRPLFLAILGGTGTGKSTLLNRLVGADVSATSYKRTFTAGAVAVVSESGALPTDWLGITHHHSSELPARGESDRLTLVEHASDLTKKMVLIDTPDVDGDTPAHHAQADRAFRWADAVLFLVTPEKYQMTELRPYYRLAERYAVPALFVMNKIEDSAAAVDFARQMNGATIYAIGRDDAPFHADAEHSLDALRNAIRQLSQPTDEQRQRGIAARIGDWLDRLQDQVIDPLKQDRSAADDLLRRIAAMETPPPGVDVNPLTRQLQRRLQQRSVLYLIGPGKMLDRIRQAPGLLARLPRTAWDLFKHGEVKLRPGEDALGKNEDRTPDFRANLVDQFSIIQSQISDVVNSSAAGKRWMSGEGFPRIDPQRAGQIADEELKDLQDWLAARWNSSPRDTRELLRLIPGGDKVAKLSEAAPYLLAAIVVTHGAFFGHVDLLILGGYSLTTWLLEKVSNEVTARAKQTNVRISQRFTELAHQQIREACQWLQSRAADAEQLDELQKLADVLHGLKS